MVTIVSARADISRVIAPTDRAFAVNRVFQPPQVAWTMQYRAELRAGRILRDVFGRYVAFCFNATGCHAS
jgi:hypothetical protein